MHTIVFWTHCVAELIGSKIQLKKKLGYRPEHYSENIPKMMTTMTTNAATTTTTTIVAYQYFLSIPCRGTGGFQVSLIRLHLGTEYKNALRMF